MRAAARVMRRTRAPTRETHDRTVAASVGPVARFMVHFGEMCVAMCLGGVLLSLAVFELAALMGQPDLDQRAPGLSTLVIAVNLAVAMVVWMRFRGMEWRPTLEMAGSSVAVGIVMTSGYWAGIVPESAILGAICLPVCVAMLPVMLFRFPLYANHHSPRNR